MILIMKQHLFDDHDSLQENITLFYVIFHDYKTTPQCATHATVLSPKKKLFIILTWQNCSNSYLVGSYYQLKTWNEVKIDFIKIYSKYIFYCLVRLDINKLYLCCIKTFRYFQCYKKCSFVNPRSHYHFKPKVLCAILETDFNLSYFWVANIAW
jgi:hypothetical protein